jgi:hypothetical protein
LSNLLRGALPRPYSFRIYAGARVLAQCACGSMVLDHLLFAFFALCAQNANEKKIKHRSAEG